MEALLQRLWYGGRGPAWLLWPLSLLFRGVSARRRRRLQHEAAQHPLPLPVIVIGNISVGGTGKTPLLIALARELQLAGLRPGIVSRGYGGRAPHYPFLVTPDSDPAESGDEARLISAATGCPVIVDPDRLSAVRQLEAGNLCDVILSDDGLQHYRMPRTVEIAVIDGQRGLGNGFCLPAGPLREPPQRLAEVDYVVINGDPSARLLSQLRQAGAGTAESVVHRIKLEPSRLRTLKPRQTLSPFEWSGPRRVHAVAGIGHPERFFATLETLGFEVLRHSFPDHHQFSIEDIVFDDGLPVLMTAKDAVKCQPFAEDHHWVLDVEVRVPATLLSQLLARISPCVS